MHILAALVFSTFFTWLIVYGNRYRDLFLFQTILMCSGMVLSFELLSLTNSIKLQNVLFASIGTIIVSGLTTFLHARRYKGCKDKNNHAPVFRDDNLSVLTCVVLFVAFATTLWVAITSVPNTFDSMTYHLPRVEHWIQNHNFNHYPTAIERQLDSGPLAERLILAMYSITNSYPFANLIQWFSYCGCILTAANITRELGGGRASQCLASIMFATLPMALLQASSTQTDLVVAFFSMVTVYSTLRLIRGADVSISVFGAILAAALAFYTKGTAAIFLSGFAFVYVPALLPKLKSRLFCISLLAASALALAMVAPQMARNYQTFKSVLGSSHLAATVADYNLNSSIYNVVRNVASFVGPIKGIQSTVSYIGGVLGVTDTDARYSAGGNPFSFGSTYLRPHEDTAANPFHAVLLLVSLVCLITMMKRLRASADGRERFVSTLRYATACVISGIVFCITLKWQPWITRLQLGEVALIVPLASVALSYISFVPTLLICLLGIQAFPAEFYNARRPILGAGSILRAKNVDVLFDKDMPHLKQGYLKLSEEILKRKPTRIGLILGEDSWEFPLWYLLRRGAPYSNIPTIVHELDGNAIDPNMDLLVYLDRKPRTVPLGMVEMPGFEPLRVFRRED